MQQRASTAKLIKEKKEFVESKTDYIKIYRQRRKMKKRKKKGMKKANGIYGTTLKEQIFKLNNINKEKESKG